MAASLVTIALARLPADVAAAVGPATHGNGSWKVGCSFSHRAPDDPIVYPGQPGRAHLHDFFGNRTTDAFSTARRLRAAAGTTCTRAPDRSAYWVPTLYAPDPLGIRAPTPIQPRRAVVYYLAADRRPRTIQPFPRGLRVVVGDGGAVEPQRWVGWYCRDGALVSPPSPTPLACGPRQRLYARVTAPDCSDGRRDSLDHQAHMTYASRRGGRFRECPARHPLPVPQLRLVVEYPPQPLGPLTLSSGTDFSLHADFFEAWRNRAVERLTSRCIGRDLICGLSGAATRAPRG